LNRSTVNYALKNGNKQVDPETNKMLKNGILWAE
jgi:hypothetical protein